MSLRQFGRSVTVRRSTRLPVDSETETSQTSQTSHSSESSKDDDQDPQQSVSDDDEVAEDVEITEGGWICRVARFEKHVDSRGRVHHVKDSRRKESSAPVANQDVTDGQKPAKSDGDETKNRVKQSIIRFFRHATKTNSKKLIHPEMYIEIKSPLILEVLRRNMSYEKESLQGKKVTFYEPYRLLWRQYHALDTYSQNQSNPRDYRTHIRVLLDFLRTCDMPNVPELIQLGNPENSAQSISFPSLWFLFTSHTLIIEQSSTLSNSRVFLVKAVKPPSRKIDRKGRIIYDTLKIDCQELGYVGVDLYFVTSTKRIEPFEGLVPYSELEFIPLNLLEKHEEKRQSLICRGQKFWDLRGPHMKEFVDGSYADRSLVENERVMVDSVMYSYSSANYPEPPRTSPPRPPEPPAFYDNDGRQPFVPSSQQHPSHPSRYHQPGYYPEPGVKSDYLAPPVIKSDSETEDRVSKPTRSISLPTGDEKPSEDILILCGYLVWGFSFRSKQWQQYHVDDLIDVDFNKRSFDRLVLREDYKTILKAMVAQHFTQGQDRFRDLVAGKGQGLNILLHGPPGVGKTLTAECIADLYERPLYSVTSGHIGTDPEGIENKLRKIFDYAVRWNAVLLLDEADVFLAERNLENLSRNALVSVFLRSIEYFDGVFFLTTNRVGTIDEAFQSRLHITLGLDPLSVEERRQIWYHFIKDLKHLSKDDRRILARHARDDWAHKDFNGRQIRNAVKTALTLARQDGVEVQARHFQIVLDIGTRFAGYMQRLKKMDRERLAEAIGTRLDLTGNAPRSLEGPVVAQAPKRKSEDERKTPEHKDLDLDWD